MRKVELLAPAGDFESLKVAVYNGADAVYLGIKQYNARNNIQGFSLDNLSQAVDFAHLYGVKVYLALNILFKDDELQSALDVVCEANNAGVDAFIIQDLGLAYLIRQHYPSVELHASTQMAIHNLEGVKILEKLGFKRVVLARETSLTEVERIHKNSNIEIEFFVQGALCVSFSGNCYMCSHLVDKSGNRGLCQQFCRLPYSFDCKDVHKQGYLLSAKDICMLDRLQDLINAGVVSLKIEGRARRPFYVAQACKIYRGMLDLKKYSSQEFDTLTMAFNRGYTPAYLDGNGNIISKIQGNNGLKIGEVVKVKRGARFNEVFINTHYELKSKSGLKFIFRGQEIASIGAHDVQRVGDLYRVTTTSDVKVGCSVNIIQDETLEQRIVDIVKKLKIDIKFEAKENEPILVSANYGDITVVEQSESLCQKAKTISISSEQILQQFSRSDVFEVDSFECKAKDVYILNSAINKLRNNIYNKLQNKIIEKYNKNTLNKVKIKAVDINKNSIINDFDFKIIENLDNVAVCDNLIYDYNIFDEIDWLNFGEYCDEHNVNGYIDLPNFATEQDVIKIEEVLAKTNLGVVANNLYAFNFDCKMIGGQFLNIYNSYTVKCLQELKNLDGLFVEELSCAETDKLKTNLSILKRERVYMTLLHCPFKQNLKCDCVNCKYDGGAYFTINSGKKFKIKRKKTSGCVFLLKD